jgi:threonine/homoserine/homoserine lactone efflux protein/glycine/D-amino acid oxidase-like deaminating enzyme
MFDYWRWSAPEKLEETARVMRPFFAQAIETHRELMTVAGAERYFRQTGWLELYARPESLAAQDRRLALSREYGIDNVKLTQAETLELEPHLKGSFAGTIWCKGADTVSSPGGVTKAYAEAFTKAGGRFAIGDAMTLEKVKGGYRVQTADGPVTARQVVVALGIWSKALVAKYGYSVPLSAKRGYHRHYKAAGNAFLNRQVCDEDVGYVLCPMEQGIRLTTGVEIALPDAPSTPVQVDRALPLGARPVRSRRAGGGGALDGPAAGDAGFAAGDRAGAAPRGHVVRLRPRPLGLHPGAGHRQGTGDRHAGRAAAAGSWVDTSRSPSRMSFRKHGPPSPPASPCCWSSPGRPSCWSSPTALGQGWRHGLPMAVGVALGDFTAMTLSMLGIGALLAASATVFTVLKWIGAAYLVYLGIKLFRAGGALNAEPRTDAASAAKMTAHAWLVTALNPKSITFFVAFLPQFIDRDADFWTQMAIFEATFLALAFANAFGYALVAARARKALVRQPARHPHLQPRRRHAAGRRRHRRQRLCEPCRSRPQRPCRPSPSCAITARWVAWPLSSAASVTTRAMVVFSGPGALQLQCMGVGRPGGGQAAAAELRADLVGRRPEVARGADGGAADRIDDDDGADTVTGGRDRRGRADAALEVGRGRAGAAADTAEGDGTRRRRGGCLIAEVAIGREAAPGLVAAGEQVEDDGAGNDRHPHGADGETAAVFREPGADPAAGVEPEGRAAGEDHGVDGLHGLVGAQELGVAAARRAAAHIDGADGRLIEDDRGRAGGAGEVGGVADPEAWNVGDVVVGLCAHHGGSRLCDWRKSTLPLGAGHI